LGHERVDEPWPAGRGNQFPKGSRVLKNLGDWHGSFIGIEVESLKDSRYCVLKLAA
jgi:hypothetical protein